MNFQENLKKFNQLMVGWVNYYKLADMKGRLRDLDQWIRRRIRACIWKKWKRVRSRFKYLKKLGLSAGKAWQFANNGVGPASRLGPLYKQHIRFSRKLLSVPLPHHKE